MRSMKVRILPMLQTEETFVGKTIREIQVDIFMNTFIERGIGKQNGWYRYETYGLRANEGDLILFQMNNTIIASAIYDMPDKAGEEFKVYVDTVKIFEPITKEELSIIIPSFKGFNNVKWVYDVRDVNMELLEQRMSVPIDE